MGSFKPLARALVATASLENTCTHVFSNTISQHHPGHSTPMASELLQGPLEPSGPTPRARGRPPDALTLGALKHPMSGGARRKRAAPESVASPGSLPPPEPAACRSRTPLRSQLLPPIPGLPGPMNPGLPNPGLMSRSAPGSSVKPGFIRAQGPSRTREPRSQPAFPPPLPGSLPEIVLPESSTPPPSPGTVHLRSTVG
jgi:hypothetical protein